MSGIPSLTVAEVASIMGVSKTTVYRLVNSRHLPAIRVGRSFRVPEQAVYEYLRESWQGANVDGL
ncbi:helix-turn-helix domain-containing protein [Streptomyces sp. F001]|uniref:helix-turn-helix domain-containing protein n=1 Tax=Streptomyces sp. F001 TaxID=1510026 RepID=UPI001F10DF8D|nr:helix-turn-helix domain-containing protein [Streptomyces sp. F001]